MYPLIRKMYDNGSEFDIKSGECSGANVLGLKLAGGIGAKYMARKDSKTLTLPGAGRLAPYLGIQIILATFAGQRTTSSPTSPVSASA